MTPHEPLVLTDEQARVVDRLKTEPTRAALLAADTGYGKTVIAVETARAIGARTILVVAPVNTIKRKGDKGWAPTITRQNTGLPIRWIDARTPESFDLLKSGEPGWYLVGREFFGLSGTDQDPVEREDGTFTPGRVSRWAWSDVNDALDMLIYDESHAVSNRWGLGAQVLRTVKPGYRLAMSATPGRNRFEGLWAPCRWLWPDARNTDGQLFVDNSKWRWAAQWAEIESNQFSTSGRKIGAEREPGAFVASLPCYIYYEAPRAETIIRRVRIPLTPVQRKMYDDMKRDALVWLGEHPLVADLPMVQKLRMRQIGLGEVSFDEDGEVVFAPGCQSAKADACLKIVTKHHPNESVVFYTGSRRFADMLVQRLPDAVLFTGQVAKAQRADNLARFIRGEVKHLVATIASIGEGTDGLQDVCNVEVWVDKLFDDVLNVQAEGRINRRGQRAEQVSRYELVADETDDDEAFTRLVTQRDAMLASLRTEV